MEISNSNQLKHQKIPAPHLNLTSIPGGSEPGSIANGNKGAIKSDTEIFRLVSALNVDSSVRGQVLLEIKAKVMAGEYQTRAAIEKAAQQITGF